MTFQSKLKICSFCGLQKRLWKAHPPTCQDCNGRNKQAAMDGDPVPRPALKAKPKPTINGKPVHTAIYLAAFGYGDTDYVPSELSGVPCVDVHHIQNRGLGSTKTEDRVENLMGLSREEHTEYGDKKHLMAFLYRKHMEFMIHCGVKFDRSWIEEEIERWSAEEIINDN